MERLTIIKTTEQAREMLERLQRVAIETRVDEYATERAKPVQWLDCTCCGQSYPGRQWWNQDTGFGLGDCCVKYNGVNPSAGESTSYGVPGIHFLIPPKPFNPPTLFLSSDELRQTAETEISANRNAEYWKRVLSAI